MITNYSSDSELLRAAIAAAAARMIAQDGMDYSAAKRKAARHILGDVKVQGNILPDNAHIEDEVRKYNALFFSETQPARLFHLRTLALQMMQQLQQFTPYLTGAVLNGSAGEHSEIHLDLFAESAKEVEIYLLNKNINFDVTETPHFKKSNESVETVSFNWQKEGIHLSLYGCYDLRGALRKSGAGRLERANLAQVQALIIESTPDETK